MNTLAKLIFEHRIKAWLGFLAGLVIAVIAVAGYVRGERENDRLSLLGTEANRRAIELMSQTLNGNLMGSVSLLGLVDPAIKAEAQDKQTPNGTNIVQMLESVGRTHDAEGVFLVAASGKIGSSWDNSGKPSTGIDVKFRPYYQMAMQGMENVYAAVSIARGDRALYFAAPVYVDNTNGTDAIGVVVARTGLLKVDDLLRDKADIALLLSPQGVVFASSNPEWIGRLAGKPTPERLKAIRDLKQFGTMFETDAPPLLPFSIDAGVQMGDGQRHAVARAPVQWNDPFGDWTLVLIEDLDRTVPLRQRLMVAGLVAALILMLGTMMLKVMQSHHRQSLVTHELAQLADVQLEQAKHKEKVATAAMLLQYAKSAPELGQTFLGEMHRIFGALNGVVYLVDRAAPDTLDLLASYACADAPPEQLAVGEGLLGQCASDRQPKRITDLPEGMGSIHSGLGSTAPAALLVVPVLLMDELLGVAELALLHMPDEATLEHVMEMARLLAMNIDIQSRSVATHASLSDAVAAERVKTEKLTFQQALVDTIPYPVFYKGPDTRFLGFNRAYEEAFGVSRDDLIGKRVLDLDYLPEADRIAYQAEDETVISAAGRVQHERSLRFADGEVHETLYYVAGFRAPDGSPGGLVGTFIDLTSLKKAENEISRLTGGGEGAPQPGEEATQDENVGGAEL